MNFSIRKNGSHEKLRLWKVPVNEQLPEIEDSNSHRRNTREVVERTIALAKIYLTCQSAPHSVLDNKLSEMDLSYLTPRESEFIVGKRGKKAVMHASWSIEAVWTLLWSLSFFEELDVPTSLCDVNRAIGIVRSDGLDGFFKNSRLRNQDQILDQCDFIYRCHWAVVENELIGSKTNLNPDVVEERHRALNWLVQGAQWDDVSLDT